MFACHIDTIFFLCFILIPLTICTNKFKSLSQTFDIKLLKDEYKGDEYYKTLLSFQSDTNGFFHSFISTSENHDKIETVKIKKSPSTFYNSIISLGNPPQELKVVFDTGSGFFWVTSTYCVQNKTCLGVPFYDHSKSKSYKPTNNRVEVSYATGIFVGKMSSETVKIGDKITITNELVGEIESMNKNVLNIAKSSGIVGLGFSETSLFNKTFFDSLVTQKQLKKNVIGFDYRTFGGEINFGYINFKRIKPGTLNKHYVIEKYFWTLRLNDVKYNEGSLGVCQKGCKVAIDTGTSAITCPSSNYKLIVNTIQLNRDCSNMNELKDLSFTIDNINYSLSAKDYVYRFFNTKNYKVECVLNIVPLDLPSPRGPSWVLGENFIKRYYSAFNRDENTVYLGSKTK